MGSYASSLSMQSLCAKSYILLDVITLKWYKRHMLFNFNRWERNEIEKWNSVKYWWGSKKFVFIRVSNQWW